MEKNKFETEPFSEQASVYAKTVMLMILSSYWWIFVLLILGCALLSVMINLAFIYVGLIILFILLPSSLMFTYFYITTTTEARIAVLSKRITFSDKGINIEFLPIKRNFDKEECDNPIQPKPVFIEREKVVSVENMGNNVRLYFKGGKYKFISIPFNVVKGDANDFLAYILQYN